MSAVEYGIGVRIMLEEQQRSLVAAAIDLTQLERTLLDKTIEVLRKYYPHQSSWSGTLFPTTFSAAPIAYYVKRTDESVTRDQCNTMRLEHRALGNDDKKPLECGTGDGGTHNPPPNQGK